MFRPVSSPEVHVITIANQPHPGHALIALLIHDNDNKLWLERRHLPFWSAP